MLKYNPKTKVAKASVKENKKIAQMWLDKDIRYCEACRPIYEIEGKLDWHCLLASSNAHRHGRVWYRGRPEELYNFVQVIRACLPAHEFLDRHPSIREKVFLLARGNEDGN